jgi:hypothetical protein
MKKSETNSFIYKFTKNNPILQLRNYIALMQWCRDVPSFELAPQRRCVYPQ